jgi:hypothetical protein
VDGLVLGKTEYYFGNEIKRGGSRRKPKNVSPPMSLSDPLICSGQEDDRM